MRVSLETRVRTTHTHVNVNVDGSVVHTHYQSSMTRRRPPTTSGTQYDTYRGSNYIDIQNVQALEVQRKIPTGNGALCHVRIAAEQGLAYTKTNNDSQNETDLERPVKVSDQAE